MRSRNVWEVPCECGCGEIPKYGAWLPGHDGRHRGHLLRAVRNDADAKAAAELIQRGWYDPHGRDAELIEGLARSTISAQGSKD